MANMKFAKIRLMTDNKLKTVETKYIENFNKYLKKPSANDIYIWRDGNTGKQYSCIILIAAETSEEVHEKMQRKRLKFPKLNDSDILDAEQQNKTGEGKEAAKVKRDRKYTKVDRQNSEAVCVSAIVNKYKSSRNEKSAKPTKVRVDNISSINEKTVETSCSEQNNNKVERTRNTNKGNAISTHERSINDENSNIIFDNENDEAPVAAEPEIKIRKTYPPAVHLRHRNVSPTNAAMLNPRPGCSYDPDTPRTFEIEKRFQHPKNLWKKKTEKLTSSSDNDYTDWMELQKGVKIRSMAYQRAIDAKEPSKCVTNLSYGIWGYKDLAKRCVKHNKNNKTKLLLSPQKVTIIKNILKDYLKSREYPQALYFHEVSKLNAYLGRAISGAIRHIKTEEEDEDEKQDDAENTDDGE